MSKQNLDKIRNSIINKLESNEVMPFIIEEVSDSLVYLNQYKLTNIQENIDFFIEKITNLHKDYCKSLIVKE